MRGVVLAVLAVVLMGGCGHVILKKQRIEECRTLGRDLRLYVSCPSVGCFPSYEETRELFLRRERCQEMVGASPDSR